MNENNFMRVEDVATGLSCCSAILGEIHCKEPFYKVWSNIIY